MAAADWFSGIPDRFPWILRRGLDCVLSPDCDGFLCGLLMSHLLDWKIRGFYNGRVLAVDESVNRRECVFLDMEICRPDVRSVGQHMLMFDKRPEQLPEGWEDNFAQCVSPNNLRGFDFRSDFARKYPLATIHLLMAVLSARGKAVPVPASAVAPLLYVDGTFKSTMNYPENCLDWLAEMDCENNGALRAVFCGKNFSPLTLMREMNSFFATLRSIAAKNADKLILNNSKGELVNLRDGAIASSERKKTGEFLGLLAEKTEWNWKPAAWSCWENLRVARLAGINFKPVVTNRNPANPGFKTRVESENPISWAITGAQRGVEMTLGHPDF